MQLTFDFSLVAHLWHHRMLRKHRIHLWYLIQVSAIAPPNHEIYLSLLLALLQSRMLALRTAMLQSRVPQSTASLLLLRCCKLFFILFVRKHVVVE